MCVPAFVTYFKGDIECSYNLASMYAYCCRIIGVLIALIERSAPCTQPNQILRESVQLASQPWDIRADNTFTPYLIGNGLFVRYKNVRKVIDKAALLSCNLYGRNQPIPEAFIGNPWQSYWLFIFSIILRHCAAAILRYHDHIVRIGWVRRNSLSIEIYLPVMIIVKAV